jgi:hypothetical protein
MIPPYNRYLVKAESNLEHEVVFKSGVKLYRYVGFDPSAFATMIATVSAIPRGFRLNLLGYEGITPLDIKIGEEVLVRYDAFSATKDQPDRDSVRYKNELYYKGESQWFVDILQILAVKRNDVWVMLNGHAWLDVVKKTDLNPLSPWFGQEVPWKGKGVVKYIGSNLTTEPELDLKPGDTVFFDSRVPMVYELDNEKFYVIKQRYIHVMEPKLYLV